MGDVKTFRDLKVWRKAHKFVLNIYAITKDFPSEEKFGLTSQLPNFADLQFPSQPTLWKVSSEEE